MEGIEASSVYPEVGATHFVDWFGLHSDQEHAVEFEDEIFLECVVCQYWSERIEEAWGQRQHALR